MHIQPHSRSIRKNIPKEEYFHLVAEQRTRSLIGEALSELDADTVAHRIQELDTLEARGFVYVGEKSWLNAWREADAPETLQHYHQWIEANCSQHLKLNFNQTKEYPHLPYPLWSAMLDATERTLSFEALHHPGFLPIDALEILVGGSELGPSAVHLCAAFEFLHGLEYTLATFPAQGLSKRPLSVIGIDCSNPEAPNRWDLTVISEYGADWDFAVVDGVFEGWTSPDAQR